MTYYKYNITLIFMLLTYYYVSADEVKTCKNDMARYFKGLNYLSCAIKSLIFYNPGDFEFDYGYLYFLTFRNHLRRGFILKPTEYCTIYFANYDKKLTKQMDDNNLREFENDEQKTQFILNLANERKRNYETSSEYPFDDPLQPEDFLLRDQDNNMTLEESGENDTQSLLGLSQSITYTFEEDDNKDVTSCKIELNDNGFPDRLTKTAVTHIFYWKRYIDCRHCKFVKGYMTHMALNIGISSNMDDSKQFCTNLGKNDMSLLELLQEQIHFNPPDFVHMLNTTDRLPDPEMEENCKKELLIEFNSLTNYKEVGDYALFNIAIESLIDGSFKKIYLEILVSYISPGYTKSIKSFCQDYINKSIFSKIKLHFNVDRNKFDTQTCISSIKSFEFPVTKDKTEIIKHAFNYITVNDETAQYDKQVYLKAYLEHIKVNYIRSVMESPARFCYFSAKNITSRTYGD